ncbi:MAG: hypothetical protein ACYDBT_05015 [Desulfobulbaceae bacterium]
MNAEASLPLEHFIQAVQSQLDNAQTAMAVKARKLNLPLTFAIKDITLDLRAHVEFARSEIRIRPAGPGDKDASLFHLVFTAITRPMIEENAVAFAEDPEEQSIDELKDDLTEEERRRLEWVGVRTVSKLKEIVEKGEDRTVGRVTSLPVDRLRSALRKMSAPLVQHVLPVQEPEEESRDLPNLLRIRGRNLKGQGPPKVMLEGEPVSVVRASENEIVIAPQKHQMSGEITVEPAPHLAATMAFDLRPFWRESSPSIVPGTEEEA